jgi:ABC-type multidrug transport system fused ATPase/permease subunit
MVEIWKLFKQGWRAITAKGRQVLWIYGVGLTLLSFIDAYALYLLSKTVLANDSSNINVDDLGQTLALVIFLFLSRSLLATGISYWGVRHFADQEVQLGSDSFNRFSKLKWDIRQTLTAVDLFSSVDRGPSALIQGVMISVVTVATEVISALIILTGIFIMQPLTAAIALTYFLLIAVAQHKLLSVASQSAGAKVASSTEDTYQLLNDADSIAKLLAITPSSSLEEALKATRSELAYARASSSFLALLPRYFMESVLAAGFLVVAGSAYIVGGAIQAASSVTIFAAAGFRLLPIVNRIQGLTLFVFSQQPTASLTFSTEIAPANSNLEPHSSAPLESTTGESIISIENISYWYPGANKPALKNLSLELKFGLQYAVVGPSGAGKTTLVDICLGLLSPREGTVRHSQASTFSKHSYVPQETNLISGSLAENIALEWQEDKISQTSVLSVVKAAQLESVFSDEASREQAFGDGGNSLSGGQRQRIGLARALYRDPDFLVLDEATSALDSETEKSVMETIENLRGKATVLIVAHRLSTIKNVDQIIYVKNGEILGVGTFDKLRSTIPDFAKQIELNKF